jgi:hypothetical protein
MMFLGFGWAVVQTSRSRLVGAPTEQVYALDEDLEREDDRLHAACRSWLESHPSPWLKWQFSEKLNNHQGLLQFYSSRNHRDLLFWQLAEFIASQSAGSWGLLHVHDDEDIGPRTNKDFSGAMRVWRILDGQLTEHDNPYFSPFLSKHAFGGESGFGK